MNAAEAVDAVRVYLGADAEGCEFQASLEKGSPDLWYVTYHAEGQHIVGGDAYIVADADAQVFAVSASMPPGENLLDVRHLLASRVAQGKPDEAARALWRGRDA